MQWYNSIFAKVTVLFAVALISIAAFSLYLIRTQNVSEHLDIQRKYNQFIVTINQIIRYGGDISLIEKYLQELNFKVVKNPRIQEDLFLEIGSDFDGVVAKILRDDDVIYMLIQTPEKLTLYRDTFKDTFKNSYILAFVAFTVVIFLYLLIIRALIPLKKLRTEIHKFTQGKADVSCLIPQNDEVGELSKEFDKAIKKIDSLNHARHLFLRTIMHELKTPITKGRIVAEMIQDFKQKERLISIFVRLNSLIEDFAKIEEMSSRNYQISKGEYYIYDILQHVFKQLLIDPQQNDFPILLPQENVIVRADFEMLSLAIKNLIDNGLKYKNKGKVEVSIEHDKIAIKNEGKPLLHPINEYFKPFFKDIKNPSSQGLGLGIYIIKNLVEAQGLNLHYKYEHDTHCFSIAGAIQKVKLKNRVKD